MARFSLNCCFTMTPRITLGRMQSVLALHYELRSDIFHNSMTHEIELAYLEASAAVCKLSPLSYIWTLQEAFDRWTKISILNISNLQKALILTKPVIHYSVNSLITYWVQAEEIIHHCIIKLNFSGNLYVLISSLGQHQTAWSIKRDALLRL